jgi:hypothetical protein
MRGEFLGSDMGDEFGRGGDCAWEPLGEVPGLMPVPWRIRQEMVIDRPLVTES